MFSAFKVLDLHKVNALRRVVGFKANKAKSESVQCLYWSEEVAFSVEGCLDSMKAPQINQIHFLLNRILSLGNETNGNEVRRGSADGAALLGCATVSSSKQCLKGKRTPGNSRFLFFGGVKRLLISTFDHLRLTLMC